MTSRQDTTTGPNSSSSTFKSSDARALSNPSLSLESLRERLKELRMEEFEILRIIADMMSTESENVQPQEKKAALQKR